MKKEKDPKEDKHHCCSAKDSSINDRTMAPRRTKMASRIKPPYARGEPEDDTVSPTHPWPREKGTEISLA
ncbi:hypothetical protein F2Q69_00054617 [Brassica cretica]|uniref:Uncharacterized protein n=1 Tax=Brassica cretica TaxID=69181 RepID=A0A8S9N088_BRACR|nr:hypothetical protein F2Q69_00054617 [Brassica cretica]